jgi:hypothetical protein
VIDFKSHATSAQFIHSFFYAVYGKIQDRLSGSAASFPGVPALSTAGDDTWYSKNRGPVFLNPSISESSGADHILGVHCIHSLFPAALAVNILGHVDIRA